MFMYSFLWLYLLTSAPKSSTSSINSSRMKAKPGKQIWPCHQNVKVNPRSPLEHFWGKIFKTFHELLCSKNFPCLILPKNKSRSTQGHYLNYLGNTLVPNATYSQTSVVRTSVFRIHRKVRRRPSVPNFPLYILCIFNSESSNVDSSKNRIFRTKNSVPNWNFHIKYHLNFEFRSPKGMICQAVKTMLWQS